MSAAFHAAFGRALSHVAERGCVPMLEPLLAQAAWELQSLVAAQCLDLAIVIRPRDGAPLVGRSSEVPPLPTASVIGLIAEAGADGAAVKVRDHAIDSARLVSAGCRSSVLVRLSLPDAARSGGDGWLWLGLVCAAAASHVDLAREAARAFGEWLAASWGALRAVEGARTELSELSRQLREATAVAHDARAPLGAMKLLLSGSATSPADQELLRAQFSYVSALLERLSPQALAQARPSFEDADVCEVMRRVAARAGAQLSLTTADAGVWCRMPELELERVLSNLVGNGCQHSGGTQVQVVVQERHGALGVVVTVADSGPGFSRDVLERFARSAPECVASSSGWGVGLASSRRSVEQCGGTLRLLQAESGGGLVEVCLPKAQRPASYVHAERGNALGLSAEKVTYGTRQQLCIVDDDMEQAESLARALAARGIESRCCATVTDALAELEGADGAVLCDATMPDGGAQRLLEALQRKSLKRRVCVMSGIADDEQLYRLAALGAESFLLKPVESAEVERWVARVRRAS